MPHFQYFIAKKNKTLYQKNILRILFYSIGIDIAFFEMSLTQN